MKNSSGLRTLAVWNGLRTLLMVLLVREDIVILVNDGDPGGYGLVPNRLLIATISALPTQLASLIAYLESGRLAALSLDLLWTALYAVIAVGLLRGAQLVRRFAIAWYVVEALLLTFFLAYLLPTFWAVWPHEVTTMSVYVVSLSLVITGVALLVLTARPSKGNLLGNAARNASGL